MDAGEMQQRVLAVTAAANLQTTREPGQALREALNAAAEHEHRAELRRRIISELPRITAPAGAGFLGIWLGAGVENGADPEASLASLWETFVRWCGELRLQDMVRPKDDNEMHPNGEVADPEDNEIEVPEELEIGLEFLGQSLVAHLARCDSARLDLAGQSEVHDLLERVAPCSVGAYWVLELLKKHSGTLIVLHMESKTGFRVRYSNISNCFHLFTLLQCALSQVLPGCRQPGEEMQRVAAGEYPVDGIDEAWWHYGNARSRPSDPGGTVWGEQSPASIPEVQGESVILLWPIFLKSRTWNSGFFGPPLHAAPASLSIVEPLSGEMVSEWWTILNLDAVPTAQPSRPWWKRWRS